MIERRIEIARTWDGQPADDEHAPVALTLTLDASWLTIEVDAPFHHDPAPADPAGRLDRLWEQEVVELFLVGSDGRYLELELGPHGHWLALSLRPVRRIDDAHVPVEFSCRIDDGPAPAASRRWRGRARVATSFVPRPIVRWNAFAIHGSGASRRHLAASAVPGDAPDFHRVELFPTFADGP